MSTRTVRAPVEVEGTPAEVQQRFAEALVSADSDKARATLMEVCAICNRDGAKFRVRRATKRALEQAKQQGDQQLQAVVNCMHSVFGTPYANSLLQQFGLSAYI